MANTLVQFRTDETEKLEAMRILAKLGLSLPEYLRMCLSRLVQEKALPFSMKPENEDHAGSIWAGNSGADNAGIRALRKASQIALEHGIQDMPLDEINAEIAEVRK